jgi:hypothetical protein
MIRRLIPMLLILAAPCAASAQDSDSETVPINGTVARLCVLGTPSEASINLGQLVNVSGARVGKLATLAPRTVSLPGSFCNFAGSTVTVSASALVAADASPIQTGFARAVNYAATLANWTTVSTVATTAASDAGASPTTNTTGAIQSAPRLADLSLSLNGYSVPSDKLLVAGAYAGQVVITLAPAALGNQ